MKYFLCFFVILFVGCTHPKPSKEEIIGTWVSSDGAIIVFKQNAKAAVIDFPLDIQDIKKGVINGDARWIIENRKSITPFWGIDISISSNLSSDKEKGTRELLLVSRSGLGGSDSKITSLFLWIGDPDLDERYEFHRLLD